MEQSNPVSHWLPCSVVFISTSHEDKNDIMTATAMFVSEKENIVAISVAKDHLTAQLINKIGRFTLIVASERQKELVWQLGSVPGDKKNKFKLFSIETLPQTPGKPLVPADAASWMECTVLHQQLVDGYVLITARVVDQQELNNNPLVWHRNALFSMKPL